MPWLMIGLGHLHQIAGRPRKLKGTSKNAITSLCRSGNSILEVPLIHSSPAFGIPWSAARPETRKKLFKSTLEAIIIIRALALKASSGTLLLGRLLAALSPNAQATLIGQMVGCSVTPLDSSTGCSFGTTVVQTTGPEFVVNIGQVEPWDIDIGPSSVHIVLNFGGAAPTEVINVALTDLFWLGSPDAVITECPLSVSGVTGLTDGDISFCDNSLGFDLASTAVWGFGSSATITLITKDRTTTSVPALREVQ